MFFTQRNDYGLVIAPELNCVCISIINMHYLSLYDPYSINGRPIKQSSHASIQRQKQRTLKTELRLTAYAPKSSDHNIQQIYVNANGYLKPAVSVVHVKRNPSVPGARN